MNNLFVVCRCKIYLYLLSENYQDDRRNMSKNEKLLHLQQTTKGGVRGCCFGDECEIYG